MEQSVEAARTAFSRHQWHETKRLLKELDLEVGLDPDLLVVLAQASWWAGDISAAIEAKERAYAAYHSSGETLKAGLMCVGLAEDHFNRGNNTVGKGWLQRAQRMLGESPATLEYGWLARLQAVIAFDGQQDVETALTHAEAAREAAARFGDRDLEELSIHDVGRFLLAKGETERGRAMMDEAMANAVGGQTDALTTGRIYCNMISTCEDQADYRRASDWELQARKWSDRMGHESGFPGICRVRRAALMRRQGAWDEAAGEAERARKELVDFRPFSSMANYVLGELHLLRGDLKAARRCFTLCQELGRDPQPGLARLRIREGDPQTAKALIGRALDDAVLPLQRAALLPTFVDVAIEAGEFEEAARAVDEIESIVREFDSEALMASSHFAAGRVALARGKGDQAIDRFRAALALWRECNLPYDEARARLFLGMAYELQDSRGLARIELEAAHAAFAKLGALPDQRSTAERLGEADPTRKGRRITCALLFTDMVGSTRLVESLGDETWSRVLGWHDRTLRALFERHGGREVDRAGDGFFVSFTTTEAALACATEIQNVLAHHRSQDDLTPEVRMGIHMGEVTEIDGSLSGMEVHVAARVSAAAGPSQILLSGPAGDQVSQDRILEWRRVEMKGITDPVEVRLVDWR